MPHRGGAHETEIRRIAVVAILVVSGIAGSLVSAVALGAVLAAGAPSLLLSQDVSASRWAVGIRHSGSGPCLRHLATALGASFRGSKLVWGSTC